jgi:hypothetical protein
VRSAATRGQSRIASSTNDDARPCASSSFRVVAAALSSRRAALSRRTFPSRGRQLSELTQQRLRAPSQRNVQSATSRHFGCAILCNLAFAPSFVSTSVLRLTRCLLTFNCSLVTFFSALGVNAEQCRRAAPSSGRALFRPSTLVSRLSTPCSSYCLLPTAYCLLLRRLRPSIVCHRSLSPPPPDFLQALRPRPFPPTGCRWSVCLHCRGAYRG